MIQINIERPKIPLPSSPHTERALQYYEAIQEGLPNMGALKVAIFSYLACTAKAIQLQEKEVRKATNVIDKIGVKALELKNLDLSYTATLLLRLEEISLFNQH